MISAFKVLSFAVTTILSLAYAFQPIKQLVNKKGVMIISKTNCPFCDKAKDLLKARNIAYEAIELDYFANPAPFVAELIEFTNQKTVPNIFINGKHIGGFDALSRIESAGQLKELNSQQEKLRKLQ